MLIVIQLQTLWNIGRVMEMIGDPIIELDLSHWVLVHLKGILSKSIKCDFIFLAIQMHKLWKMRHVMEMDGDPIIKWDLSHGRS